MNGASLTKELGLKDIELGCCEFKKTIVAGMRQQMIKIGGGFVRGMHGMEMDRMDYGPDGPMDWMDKMDTMELGKDLA